MLQPDHTVSPGEAGQGICLHRNYVPGYMPTDSREK